MKYPVMTLLNDWETDMKLKIRKACGRESIEMVYERLLDSYCTPEIRYRNLDGTLS